MTRDPRYAPYNAGWPSHEQLMRMVERALHPDPLEDLEAIARAIHPRGVERGQLWVLYLGPDDFDGDQYSYQWGDASISRTEAAKRARSNR